jgi:uncharacterized membrane protein
MNFLHENMKVEYFCGSLMLILGLMLSIFRDEMFTNAEPYRWCLAGIVLLALYEFAVVFVVHKKYKSVSPRQSINLLMGLKIGKILLSAFFIMIYVSAVKLEIKRFVLVFLVIYLCFLVFDTLFIINCEKKAGKQIRKE